MSEIVLDLEIEQTVEQAGGWDNTDRMGVSVLCIWDCDSRRMLARSSRDLEDVQRRIHAASRVITYNGWRFDYPVIWGVSKGNWEDHFFEVEDPVIGKTTVGRLKGALEGKEFDILRRIWKAKKLDPDRFSPKTHGGFTLEKVSRETLGDQHSSKTMNGDLAPVEWQKGNRVKVMDYCSQDVALTRDLYEFAMKHGYVLDPKNGRKIHL